MARISKRQVQTTLRRLAREHPERYDSSPNTPHKAEMALPYSYEDCIAGCVIREHTPDLHAEMIDYEDREHQSFVLRGDDLEDDAWELVQKVREAYTPGAFDLMASAQRWQDAGYRWPAALKLAEGKSFHEVGFG